MKEIMSGVNRAMKMELNRDEFPPFRSDYEGLGIITREVYEATHSAERVQTVFAQLASCIFEDNHELARRRAKRLRENALYTACEFVEVAAMAEKFYTGESSFTQEEADSLAERYSDEDFEILAPSFLKNNKGVIDACKKLSEAIDKAEEEEDAE